MLGTIAQRVRSGVSPTVQSQREAKKLQTSARKRCQRGPTQVTRYFRANVTLGVEGVYNFSGAYLCPISTGWKEG